MKKEIRMESYVMRSKKLISNGDTEKAKDLICTGMVHYSNRVIKAITPYATADAGMVVIALRNIADQIEKNNSAAKDFADRMSKVLIMPDLIEKERKAEPNMH